MYWIAVVSSYGATYLRKQVSAFAPLNNTRSMRWWFAKNPAKSFASTVAWSMSESRLPWRWQEASTSHTEMPEARMDVCHVADAVLYMANLPLDANVQFMTLMATTMPFVGRG